MILGIDISSIQGKPNWKTLAPHLRALGVRFVIARSGYGNEPENDDPACKENLAGARGEGFDVGIYDFGMALPEDPAHPGRAPEEQAERHFELSLKNGWQNDDITQFLDLEWPWPTGTETVAQCWARWKVTKATIRAWGVRYLARKRALLGRPAGLYNGFPNFWKEIDGASESEFANSYLWDVAYPWGQKSAREPVDGESPPATGPWAGWSVWQYTGGGVPILGGVDGDCIADEATLKMLRGLP